jgi:hypothetical protein
VRYLKAAWKGLGRFWLDGCDPAPAGLFRIVLGLFIVLLYLLLLPSWERYYGADGVLATGPQYADWMDIYYWAGPGVPALVWGILGLLAALAFTVGWRTRAAAVVLFVLELSRSHHGRFVSNGEDLVVRMLLFYACFAPLGRAFSLDARRVPRGRPAAEPDRPSVWPLRMMQVNLLLIYLLSLPNKLIDDEAWWNGDAVYWSIVSDMWSRWPWPALFFDYGGAMAKIATFGTVVTEGLAPWLVWFRRTRPFALAALVSMHLGIAIILQNVTFFSLSMIVGLLLFLSPGEARAVVRVARRAAAALLGPLLRRSGAGASWVEWLRPGDEAPAVLGVAGAVPPGLPGAASLAMAESSAAAQPGLPAAKAGGAGSHARRERPRAARRREQRAQARRG